MGKLGGLLGLLQFQSTHPRGVRHERRQIAEAQRDVSIHAPAWGATPDDVRVNTVFLRFNPRTRVGCDVSMFYPVDSRD